MPTTSRCIAFLRAINVGGSESVISNAVFEKTLGQRSTVRGISTVRKMAEKYGS